MDNMIFLEFFHPIPVGVKFMALLMFCIDREPAFKKEKYVMKNSRHIHRNEDATSRIEIEL